MSHEVRPSVVVLNAVTGDRVQPVVAQLRALADRHPLALGGAAAKDGVVDASCGPEASRVLALTGDLIADATRVTALVQGGARR